MVHLAVWMITTDSCVYLCTNNVRVVITLWLNCYRGRQKHGRLNRTAVSHGEYARTHLYTRNHPYSIHYQRYRYLNWRLLVM